MALPLTIDCPNLSPNPASACAAALSVRFSLTGSTFSEIEVMVWNNVLISVVTDLASITVCGLRAFAATGCSGVVSDTYLPPNTVVALISAFTLAGISDRYLGYTSRANFAAGLPSRLISEMLSDPADLDPVVGDLRARVHHQPGPRRRASSTWSWA